MRLVKRVGTALLAASLLLTGCNVNFVEPAQASDQWEVEMSALSSFREYTYFDGDEEKVAEISYSSHGGDDTALYPTVTVDKSANTLVFPTPNRRVSDGVFAFSTWGDYEEKDTGEEILNKPVFEVRMDGDVYDVVAHEYYYDDASLGKRMCQIYINKKSSIKRFRLYGEGLTSDMSVHVLYGTDSVLITADTELAVELTIESTEGSYIYEENVTISETPVTIRKDGLKYIIE